MIKVSVKSRLHKPLLQLALVGASLVPATQVLAQDAATDSNFKLSGYVSLVGGKVLSGNLDANYAGPPQIKGVNCPCYVADWGNAGVYGDDFSLTPESRVGIQGKYTINNKTSLTAQLVSRGTNGTPDVTWAYGSYKFNENFEVQVGRKRIPLYYYSDFQDIGVSYPWITPPPELYGWEAANYNGASVRYSRNMGDTNLTASLFTGQEKVKKSLYQKLYYPDGDTEVQWNNLIGADIEVNNGPLTVRAVVMKADVRSINNDPATLLDDASKLQAYGLAANLDFDKWFVLSEFTQLTRDYFTGPYKVTAPAFTIGAGMRLGKWTPFINFAKYTEETTDSSLYPALSSYKRTSVTLRYDLDSSSAVKAQLDKNYDVANNFGGDATVLRVSYDRVF
jgi:hypothetical protein